MASPIFIFNLIHQTDENGPIQFSNGDFSSSISGWSNYCLANSQSFTYSSGTAKADASVSHHPNTCYFGQQRSGGWDQGKYVIDITASNTSVTAGATLPYESLLSVYGSQDGISFENVSYLGNGDWTAGAGSSTNRITFTTTKSYNYLFFGWNKVGPTSNYYVILAIDEIEIISAPRYHAISEPDGWVDAKLVLERDKDFHSLTEHFEGDFIFYGNNGTDDGGIDFIKSVERNYGVDADIYIYIQASFDSGASYEDIFTGLLDLPNSQEVPWNKLHVPVLPINTWIQFYKKKDTKIDLQATVDLNGNPITPISPITITLTSQKIRRSQRSERDLSFAFGGMTSSQGAQIGFDKVILDEMEVFYDQFSAVDTVSTESPTSFLVPKEAGDYSFDIKAVFSRIQVTGSGTIPDPFVYSWENLSTWFQIFFQVNNETPSVFTRTDQSSGATKYSEFTYTTTRALKVGDRVRIYGDAIQTFVAAAPGSELVQIGTDPTGSEQNNTTLVFPLSGLTSHLLITADTIYPDNDAQGFLIHDAGAAIIQGMGLGNTFYSEFLGSPSTTARTYADEGCQWRNAVMQGLQIRGYTLTEKRFAMSFMEWWKGANPLLNLGLGLKSDGNFEVEDKASFYDKDNVSLYIDNIIVDREFDEEYIFNKVVSGFSKWKSEDISGIDDPQARHDYALRYRNSGKELSIICDWIAASMAWEFTRRASIKESKDYKYDNDTFVVSTNDGSGGFVPELDENFNSVTGLLNSTTRYNIIHTPLRMVLRWANYLGCCLQKYTTSSYKFITGEGNYDMVSDADCSTEECRAIICDSLDEGQDIPLGSPSNYNTVFGFMHLHDLYTTPKPIPFAWEDYTAIRNNKKYAIAISQTESNHTKFFIKKLSYTLSKSEALFVGFPAIYSMELEIPESVQPPPDKLGWEPIDPRNPVDPTPCDTIFYQEEFLTTLDGWTNEGTDIPTPTLEALSGWDNANVIPSRGWTPSSTPDNSLNGDGDVSDYTRGSFASVGGVTYTFGYQIEVTGGSNPASGSFDFVILDNSNNVLATQNVPFTNLGVKSGSVMLTPSANGTYFAIRATNTTVSNTKSFEIQVASFSGSATPLPSWIWNSSFAGSAKAIVSYEDYGVKNLVLDPHGLPAQDCRIRIRYAIPINNSNITLTLNIKDSGGSVIFSSIFASNVILTSEQESLIDISSATIQTNANKFEIVASSTDFDIGDTIYITDYTILNCVELTPSCGAFDADYQAVIDRAILLGYDTPSCPVQILQNQMVLDLKAANIWNSLDVLYVPATDGDSDFATLNWISPANFQLTKVNSPLFTPDVGFTGNGTSSYLNTNWDPSTNAVNYLLNDASMFCFINNDYTQDSGIAFGSRNVGFNGQNLFQPKSGGQHVFGLNGGNAASRGSSVTADGFYHIERRASNDERVFKNGSQVGTTVTTASNALTTSDTIILALQTGTSLSNYCIAEIGLFGAGASLSGKETDLYNAWNDYFTSL